MIFSVFSGLSLAFSYRTSSDTPELGFGLVMLNFLNQISDSRFQEMIMILSIIFSIFFIYGLTVFIRQIYEHRLVGILTAVLGFSGSFLIFGVQEQNYFIVGLVFWITGIVVIVLNKSHLRFNKP